MQCSCGSSAASSGTPASLGGSVADDVLGLRVELLHSAAPDTNSSSTTAGVEKVLERFDPRRPAPPASKSARAAFATEEAPEVHVESPHSAMPTSGSAAATLPSPTVADLDVDPNS